MASYLPILVMGVLAAALPLGTIILARVIQTRRPNPAKAEPYECGVDIEMLIFLVILVIGYFYVWKRKALDWA